MNKNTASQIEQIKTADLVPYARNAKKHDEAQVAKIAGSIREFGFNNPVLIDADNGIIAGHGRVMAAQKLSLERVPCLRLTHLTDAQKRAYILADNRLAELGGGWDAEMLKLELADLGELDVDLDGIGFGADDLQDLELSEESETSDIDAEPQIDKAEELRAKWGVEPGQLWELGEHRLLCGDSTKKEDVARVMGGEMADMIFTDPPYNHASENDGVAAAVSKAHKDLMASEWDKNFSFASIEKSIEQIMGENCTVYICTSWHLAGDIWKWMSKRSSYNGYCVWSKPNPMPSLMKRHWTWASELICYATYGKHTFNFPNDGHALNVWTITKHSDGSHPTQKPVELVSHAVAHSSNAGDLVADIFSGSGTTLIACENLKRKCRAIEISPAYVAVALQRWADATGKTPKLVA